MINGKPESSRRLALEHYGELARIGKVLGSPVRLQLLDLLRQGARTVDALAAEAGISVANASQHLQQMRSSRLVQAERRGQFVEYRVAGEDVSTAFGALRDLAESLLPEMTRLRRELGALDEQERRALLTRIGRGDVTLVDVRPVEEYLAGHLPGALSMPLAELRRRLSEIPRHREVVAYCRGPYCTLAATAARILAAAGFRARHLDLGVPDLRARRFRISTGAAAPAPRRRASAARHPSPQPRTTRKTP
ncbi:MAG TPA: metalloregulator ArsR/SmtB family transcription factor [Anaeromyxobacteraceae bacterium]|nr:metalloregulator ArsR/SmtB family transcription factor [Anaeromyxobacteraceae bacterium]